MARLINADCLKGCKILKPYKGESVDNVFIREIELDEIPTAYDVEKVVEELREVTEHNVDIYENKEDGESWNDDIVSASEAIGIVRKGGVE